MPGGAGSRDPIDPTSNELLMTRRRPVFPDEVVVGNTTTTASANDNDSDETTTTTTMTMAGEGGLRRRKVIHAARETIDKGEFLLASGTGLYYVRQATKKKYAHTLTLVTIVIEKCLKQLFFYIECNYC